MEKFALSDFFRDPDQKRKQALVVVLFWIFSFFTGLSPIFANPEHREIDPLLREIIAEAYPELQSIALKTGQFSEPDSFLQSNFEVWSLFSQAPIYVIEINPQLWELNCPELALRAILAHELAHTLDYHLGKIPGILGILNQLRLYPSLRSYEHRTDLQAIFRGYGPGLSAYREWLYPLLDAEQKQRKQEVYYTPSEIGLLQKALKLSQTKGKSDALRNYWLEHVPLDENTIRADLKRFGLDLGS
jgi:hypothetical protein